MTKKEFIDSMADMPDDAELLMFDDNRLCWRSPNVLWYDRSVWQNDKREEITDFIGLE